MYHYIYIYIYIYTNKTSLKADREVEKTRGGTTRTEGPEGGTTGTAGLREPASERTRYTTTPHTALDHTIHKPRCGACLV